MVKANAVSLQDGIVKKRKKYTPSKQVLKDLKENGITKAKGKKQKTKIQNSGKKGVESEQEIILPPVRSSEDKPAKKVNIGHVA